MRKTDFHLKEVGFGSREQKIVNWFLQNIEPSKILDIPCGGGRLLKLAEVNCHKIILGIDNHNDQRDQHVKGKAFIDQ